MSHTFTFATAVAIVNNKFTAPVKAALDRMLSRNDRVLQEHRVASFAVTLLMEAFFGNIVESDRFAHTLAANLRAPLKSALSAVLGTLDAASLNTETFAALLTESAVGSLTTPGMDSLTPLREIVARSLEDTFTHPLPLPSNPLPSDPLPPLSDRVEVGVERYWIFTPEQRDASNLIPDCTVEALYMKNVEVVVEGKDGKKETKNKVEIEIIPWLHGELKRVRSGSKSAARVYKALKQLTVSIGLQHDSQHPHAVYLMVQSGTLISFWEFDSGVYHKTTKIPPGLSICGGADLSFNHPGTLGTRTSTSSVGSTHRTDRASRPSTKMEFARRRRTSIGKKRAGTLCQPSSTWKSLCTYHT
jgi:hypothetical protein